MPAMQQDILDDLARTAVFGVLDAPVRAALLPHAAPHELRGGDLLFRIGDRSDALYVLCSGSLGVFGRGLARGAPQLLGVIAPGETVGELGFLTGQPRTATVRALRDCTLLRLHRSDVMLRLMAQHPQALAESLRHILNRLGQRAHGEVLTPPRTFAMVGVHGGLALRDAAERLAAALRPLGATLLLDAGTGRGRDPAWHTEREREHRFVLYVADRDDAAWRATCLRQADQFLLLADTGVAAQPWPDALCRSGGDTLHRTRRLLLVGPSTPERDDISAWLRQFSGEVLPHRLRSNADYARLARHLAQRAVGLVLSGGGARGFGHIGVVRALRELGQPIDAVGGTSIGAIVGAGVACEWDDAEMLEQLRRNFIAGHPLRDLTVPLIALTRGTRTTRLLQRAFAERRIEDLAIPFFCISTNLTRGRVDVHRRGRLWKWLRAGAAIPGILPPLLDRGMVHVDGAVLNNLPTDVMRDSGVHDIIAVDISGANTLPAAFEDAALPTLPRLTWQWLHGRQWPSLFAILMRAAMVQSEASSEMRRALATRLLTPPHDDVGLLNWRAWSRTIDNAYRYTLEHYARGQAAAAVPAPTSPRDNILSRNPGREAG